jgi:hypothetical protein
LAGWKPLFPEARKLMRRSFIQLRALGASSRDGVLKSVELRVDYESRWRMIWGR